MTRTFRDVPGNIEQAPFSNELTPAEAERLALMAEECGEAVHIIGKILRHGYESYNPDGGDETNRQLLTAELGDIYAGIKMLADAGDLKMIEVLDAADDKAKRVRQYLHHQ
jgi:hypothetical protein